MERFHITVGDRTTAGGIVRSGSDLSSIIDRAQACEGDQYQLMVGVRRFHDYRNPDEERYLITFQLAAPWVQP